jgi:hypothetical protein
MKKWIYLIIPGTMLAVFLVFYFAHEKERTERETSRKAVMAQKLAEEARIKAETEEQARKDAARKHAEREAEEKRKEDERQAKQAAADKQIRDETNAARAEADNFSKQAQELQAQLEQLRKDKDRMSREAFDLAKEVELAKVARRNAELEAQRMVEMIARRAADSALTRPPMVPPTTTAAAGRPRG